MKETGGMCGNVWVFRAPGGLMGQTVNDKGRVIKLLLCDSIHLRSYNILKRRSFLSVNPTVSLFSDVSVYG